MSDPERDDFLRAERTCRVATVGPDGPHATPLWFVWHGASLWLYSLTRSQRWADLERDPRDRRRRRRRGRLPGTARRRDLAAPVEPVGEAAAHRRRQRATSTPVELAFARKYFGQDAMFYDGKHGWLRVTPAKISSWDFRKLAEL